MTERRKGQGGIYITPTYGERFERYAFLRSALRYVIACQRAAPVKYWHCKIGRVTFKANTALPAWREWKGLKV